MLFCVSFRLKVTSCSINRAFLLDVTAAPWVPQTNPQGFELYSYANLFFCFDHVMYGLVT